MPLLGVLLGTLIVGRPSGKLEGIVIPPVVPFLLSMALAICDLLCFQMNFRFFNLCGECHWDFGGNCVEQVDCFW
jgi:hypothetical protein